MQNEIDSIPVPAGYVRMLPDRRIKGRHMVYDMSTAAWTKTWKGICGSRVGTMLVIRKINSSDLVPSVVTS
jgi:hypothetical protein